MKLNIVCPKLQGTGGTETVLVDVINRLTTEYEVNLLLSNYPKESAWLKKLPNNMSVSYPRNSTKYCRLFFFLRNFLFASNEEVFIVLGANLLRFASKIRSFTHKKYRIISWIHFSLVNQDMFNPKNLLYADEHLAISGQIKKQLLDLGVSSDKIHLVYNPIKKGEIIKEIYFDNSTHIIYIGRILFDGQKNLKELFDAVAKVKTSIYIDIYGVGEDEEKCQMYVKSLGIENIVKWHGWKKNVWNEIKVRPHALVLTSKFEGLPMVMLEAMAHGIPCITTRFEGYEDILNEGVNGFSYESGDVDTLVEIFNELKHVIFNPHEIQDSISQCYADKYYHNLLKILHRY